MIKNPLFLLLTSLATLCLGFSPVKCQSAANGSQQLAFAGLRSVAQRGQINGIQSDALGNLYLLLDQGDGIRLLKVDNAASIVLAQAELGGKGDSGIGIALDPNGNVYVTGTTTSNILVATMGAAISTRTDSSTQSFVAKFDTNLNPVFVTFTGGSRIAAAALAATADAVFITGITYASNLPVTPNSIQQSPAVRSSQNGFVEKFSASGSTLLYATYLTGANGSTTPAAIASDPAGNAYIVGQTTATGYPTVAALVPNILSNPSGFLTKLTPAGDGFTFSTFIPGAGLTSVALDSTGEFLLVSGAVAHGQFPVDTVTTPIIPATYQAMLRIPLNGSSVKSSTLIGPATQSFVAAGPDGSAWVDGILTAPLLPLTPLATLGSGFAVHIPAGAAIDQTARFGGLPNLSPAYSSLFTSIVAIAVDPAGDPLIGGSVQPTASSSLLATETYDLPLSDTPTTALPSTITAAELTAAICNGSLCAGSAAYLAKLNPNASAASLAFSADALPFVILRNLGTAEADNLQLTPTSGSLTSNCPTTLYPGGECDLLLSSEQAGTLTASSSTARTQSVPFSADYGTAPASTIVFYPKELDFGIQTSIDPTRTRVVTVTNLGNTMQTFTSALDTTVNTKTGISSPFSEVTSDCSTSGAVSTKQLAAGATCHITFGFIAASNPASDGSLSVEWSLGSHDVLLTGYSQAAALSVSASEVDFGTQFTTGFRLPRYLYLSNASTSSFPHTATGLPTGSAFTIADSCPATLLPNTICRIRIDYLAAQSASSDSSTLALDHGLSVLLTGQTMPPASVTGTSINPNLSVSPATVTFTNPVTVTSVAGTTQTVTIANSGVSAFALSLSLIGDFTDVTNCGATLAGGQTCTIIVSFAPSQPGLRQGLLLVIAGAATTPNYVELSGAGIGILPANNGTLTSGSVPVAQPVTQFYKVSQPFNALTATATGPFTVILVEDAGFGPGQPASNAFSSTTTGTCFNCYLGIQFLPPASGPQDGILTLISTPAGSPYTLNLAGTGLPVNGLLLTPLSASFGTVPVQSTSDSQLFTLTNLTEQQQGVNVSAATLTGDFASASTDTGGQPCAGNLAYGSSCFIEIVFMPTAAGTRSGTLTFATPSSTVVAALTGIGTEDPGLAISPTALTFNSVPGQSSTQRTISLTNTGATTLQIGTPSITTLHFNVMSACTSLAPATSCSITVSFLPTSSPVTDILSFTATRTTSPASPATFEVALNGNYSVADSGLQILPNSAQFGPTPTSQQGVTQQFTVNNLTAKSLSVAVAIPRNFVLIGAPCTALAANASCTFSLAFLPLTNGTISGTVSAQGTPKDGSAAVQGIGYLEGYGSGTGTLTISGALIVDHVFDFGQITSGQSLAQTFTLSNFNSAETPAITVRRVTSQPPFLSTSNCGMALAVGQNCSVTVTYAPSNQVASGSISRASTSDAGSITIESDGSSSTDVINFTGQGAPVAVSSPATPAPLASFTLSQSSLTFSTTVVGDISSAQSITVTNSGSITAHFYSISTSADFMIQTTCATLLPGATCILEVTATPQASGVRSASLEISSDSATSLEFLSLLTTGAPSQLTVSPGQLSFAPLLIGNTETLPVQVTNSGPTAVTFSSVSATGDFTTAGTCPASGSFLAAESSCTVEIIFKPSAGGIRNGFLLLASSASTNPLTIALTGTGLQSMLTSNPAALAFSSVTIGSSTNRVIILTNTGSNAITNLALAITGDYAVTVPCQATLAPLASCTAQVTFTPVALGTRTGILVVTSSDPGSPAAITLTGTGIGGSGFLLTAGGTSSSSITVIAGQPANYGLILTPMGGFTGTVALTCTSLSTAEYASCSLLPSNLTVNGSPQTSTATINTITSMASVSAPGGPRSPLLQAIFACLLVPGLLTLWRGRGDLREHRKLLLALIFCALSVLLAGCGSKLTSNASTSSDLYTPPGIYHYQVTANSTSGIPITQSVTLNLTITAK